MDSKIIEKVETLLNKMTLKEKIGQTNQVGASIYGNIDEHKFELLVEEGKVGSFLSLHKASRINKLQRIAIEKSRLGIPLLFCDDVIHGIKTVFPIPLAESCSFEPELAKRSAEIASFEASACGLKLTFAPMVDIALDARWGRIAEGAGEDPYLGSLFSKARVLGFQGEESIIDKHHIAACAKHFVGYGACESGKDYNSVQVGDNKLLNMYLPPFKAAIDANCKSIMSAFHELNGVPCSVNSELLKNILRNKMGFKGVVISDWNSIGESIDHGYCFSRIDACKEALLSHLNIDMMSSIYIDELENLIKENKEYEKLLDEMVKEILTLKYELGLFDNPYVDENREENEILTNKALEVALESSLKSIVLLTNNGVLPLGSNKKVLLVGRLADDKTEHLGCWSIKDEVDKTITVYEGLKKDFDVTYIKEYNKEPVNKYDAIIALLGESNQESGEAASKANIELSSFDIDQLSKLKETGKPLICLLTNGRPLALGNIVNIPDAIVECFKLGTMMGKAINEVITGRFNPEGRLSTTFPEVSGQCPIYYNHYFTGRAPKSDNDGYVCKFIDYKKGGLFPFGYGLSYSSFEYESISINKKKFRQDEIATINVSVKNVGKYKATETVQLYFCERFSKPVRPIKELCDFKKITIDPNQTIKVTFNVNLSSLGKYVDYYMNKDKPFGKCMFYVGKNSKENTPIEIEIEKNKM